MASTARSHVEGIVMLFCSTCWLLRVCREILCNHVGILAAFWVTALSAKNDFVLQEHELLLVLAIVE